MENQLPYFETKNSETTNNEAQVFHAHRVYNQQIIRDEERYVDQNVQKEVVQNKENIVSQKEFLGEEHNNENSEITMNEEQQNEVMEPKCLKRNQAQAIIQSGIKQIIVMKVMFIA